MTHDEEVELNGLLMEMEYQLRSIKLEIAQKRAGGHFSLSYIKEKLGTIESLAERVK